MSKDKPEVGDVWINTKNNKKIYITGLGNHVYVVSDSGVASSRWYCDFNKLYTYLSKSKCSINDLFETEDEPHGLYCNTCGRNVFDDPLDYYMLKDKVWKEICDKRTLSPHNIICKRCGEKFLGRKFTPEDMTDAPVNYFYNDDGTRILKILKR